MQCNWLRTVTNLYPVHQVARIWSRQLSRSSPIHKEPSPPLTSAGRLLTAESLTNPQLSRATAAAVRVALARSEYENAIFLLKSLHASGQKSTTGSVAPRWKVMPPRFVPIDFGRPVSYRLAAHALLHGLLRAGMSRQAAEVAQWMMRKGVKMHSLSFQATVKVQFGRMPDGQQPHPNQPLVLEPTRIPDGPKVMHLNSEMASHPSMRFAIHLLLEARRYRQRRTQEIWEWLFHTCLLQGELIVATLLFTILVKDFALKRQLTVQLAQQTTTSSSAPLPSAPHDRDSQQERLKELEYLNSERIRPHFGMLRSLMRAVGGVLACDPPNDPSSLECHMFRQALQSLVLAAQLLDMRALPFSHIASLIRTMYNCPLVGNTSYHRQYLVWVSRKKRAIRINPYGYCHSVLKRLVHDLPSYPLMDAKRQERPTYVLFPLDIRSYNSLLHYALRIRLSPDMANCILDHMVNRRHPPLRPCITTYNILLRSCTLLQKNDLAGQILNDLRRRAENREHGIQVEAQENDKQEPEPKATILYTTDRYSQALYRIENQGVSLPVSFKDASGILAADSYTLTSYITHLISTGNPGIVSQILFYILPELHIVDHPSYGSLSAEERKHLRRYRRMEAVRKAVSYGPWVFTAVLNALVKVGTTGLAERVWLLAKEAERTSWLPEFWREERENPSQNCDEKTTAEGGHHKNAAAEGGRHTNATTKGGRRNDAAVEGRRGRVEGPWCLPVQAYTTMIQCYASEAHKSSRRRFRNRSFIHKSDNNDDADWYPRKDKRFVRGWAQWFLKRRSLEERMFAGRAALGANMGFLLVREMQRAGKSVYESMLQVQDYSRGTSLTTHIKIPQPDARFFNAALSLYTNQPDTYVRRPHLRLQKWKGRLQRAVQAYAREGKRSRYWSPFLQEIAMRVVEAGYELPTGFHSVLVGRGVYPMALRRRELARKPFAFPRGSRTNIRPYALHTYKQKGLPRVVPRSRRKGRRRFL